MKCKKCGCGEMEDFWSPSQGTFYQCPKCNWRPGEEIRAGARSVQSVVSRSSVSARSKVLADPVLGFALRLAEKMMAEHGYDEPVIFSEKAGSCAGEDGMFFGFQSIRYPHEVGFVAREYKTYKYLWAGRGKMEGLEGVWGEVVHEFGHVIQCKDGQRFYGQQHNHYWAERVRELQVLYPFEEVAAL